MLIIYVQIFSPWWKLAQHVNVLTSMALARVQPPASFIGQDHKV